MAFSKVKTDSIADDAVTAVKVDDDGTGYTVGNLTNSGTLQQTGQVTIGTGSGSGGSFTLPTARGAGDKYVLQINTTSGAATWEESLTAPEISSHNFNVSGTDQDGGINKYEEPYTTTGNTQGGADIRKISNICTQKIGNVTGANLFVGQYISGSGIPADTTITAITTPSADNTSNGTITISADATSINTGTTFSIQKTPGEKNGGKVTLTGTNFGINIADISVAITDSGGGIIANASYLSGLSGGTTITAEWTGTEGTYSTKLKSGHADYIGDSGKIYFKMTKAGLASNVHDTTTTLTSDPTYTATPGQTGGEVGTAPSTTSLGVYGAGRAAGGGQASTTELLANFDKYGGRDFEDSSNIGADGTQPGHRMTENGDVKISASPFGDGKTAIYFDGTGDYLTVPHDAAFNIDENSTFSIDFWLYTISSATNDNIMSKTATGNTYQGWDIRWSNTGSFSSIAGAIGLCNNNNGVGICTVQQTIDTHTWYHFAFTGDGTTLRAYLNGVLKHEVAQSNFTPDDHNNPLHIGKFQNFADREPNHYLDEIRFVNGEVPFPTAGFDVPQKRYGTTGATNEVSTAGNMKLLIHSDKAGDRVNGTEAILLGTSYFQDRGPSGLVTSSFRANGSGAGLEFRGKRTAANSLFDITTGDFTIDFWVRRRHDHAGGARLYSGFATDTYEGPVFYMNSSEQLLMYWSESGSGSGWNINNGALSEGTFTMADNTWYHMAIVREGTGSNNVKIYVDATLRHQQTANQTVYFPANNGGIQFGRDGNGGSFLNGNIMNFRISNTSRYTNDAKGDLNNSGTIIKPSSTYTGNFTGTGGGLDQYTKFWAPCDNYIFTDSSSSARTISIGGGTPQHTHNHRGIKSAIEDYHSKTWPASGKRTSSSGAYFDGTSDFLALGAWRGFGTAKFTIEFWMKMSRGDSTGDYIPIMGNVQSTAGYFNVNLKKVGMQHNLYVYENSTQHDSGYAIDDNEWHHCLVTRDASNVLELWADGTRRQTWTGITTNYNNTTQWRIGHDANQGYYFGGYLDGIRIVIGEDMTSVSGDPIYSTNGTTYSVPTRHYGTFGSASPGVGTITLTAASSSDLTWSSVGTALPTGLTLTDGGGSANTATITGTLPADTTSTIVNGTRSDKATSNILLRARDETDITRAITLGSDAGMTLTQNSTGKPVGFAPRRFKGNASHRTISEFGFQPDLIWTKNLNSANYHGLFDSVRGNGLALYPNETAVQDSYATHHPHFEKDGYSLRGSVNNTTNKNDDNYISYAWKAGGKPSSTALNLSGGVGAGTIANTGNVTGITSSVDQNAGFSITKYTGTAADAQIPHNLGVVPEFVIIKNLASAVDWYVWHKSLSSHNVRLNLDGGETSVNSGHIGQGSDAPTSTVVKTKSNGGSSWDNVSGATNYIMYAWRGIAGLSAFGSHSGALSSVTGTTVGSNGYCGFAPRFVLIKRKNGSGNWAMFDALRGGSLYLEGESSAVEQGPNTISVGFTSTGFTAGTHAGVGASGGEYISIAFA